MCLKTPNFLAKKPLSSSLILEDLVNICKLQGQFSMYHFNVIFKDSLFPSQIFI